MVRFTTKPVCWGRFFPTTKQANPSLPDVKVFGNVIQLKRWKGNTSHDKEKQTGRLFSSSIGTCGVGEKDQRSLMEKLSQAKLRLNFESWMLFLIIGTRTSCQGKWWHLIIWKTITIFHPRQNVVWFFWLNHFHLTAKTGLCFRTLFFFNFRIWNASLSSSHLLWWTGPCCASLGFEGCDQGYGCSVAIWCTRRIWGPLGTGLFNIFFGGGKNWQERRTANNPPNPCQIFTAECCVKNHQSSEAEKFHPPKQGTFGWVFSHKDECEATKPIQQLGCLAGDRTFPAGEELRATLLLQLFATSVWWGFGMGQGGKSWKACCFCRFPL